MWSAAGDDEERGNHHKTATVRDRWTRVEYVFPRKHSEFTWAEGGSKIAEHISQGGAHPISKVCCYILLYICVLILPYVLVCTKIAEHISRYGIDTKMDEHIAQHTTSRVRLTGSMRTLDIQSYRTCV